MIHALTCDTGCNAPVMGSLINFISDILPCQSKPVRMALYAVSNDAKGRSPSPRWRFKLIG